MNPTSEQSTLADLDVAVEEADPNNEKNVPETEGPHIKPNDPPNATDSDGSAPTSPRSHSTLRLPYTVRVKSQFCCTVDRNNTYFVYAFEFSTARQTTWHCFRRYSELEQMHMDIAAATSEQDKSTLPAFAPRHPFIWNKTASSYGKRRSKEINIYLEKLLCWLNQEDDADKSAIMDRTYSRRNALIIFEQFFQISARRYILMDDLQSLQHHLRLHESDDASLAESITDRSGATLLHYAVAYGRFNIVQFLLQNYGNNHQIVDLRAVDNVGWNPLSLLDALIKGRASFGDERKESGLDNQDDLFVSWCNIRDILDEHIAADASTGHLILDLPPSHNIILPQYHIGQIQHRHVLVIVNPFSGLKRGVEWLNEVVAPILDTVTDVTYDVLESTNDADLQRFGREFDHNKYRGVILIGGDGTISEFVKGVRDRELLIEEDILRNVPMHPLPAGSGNGLSSSIGFTNVYDGISLFLDGLCQLICGMTVEQPIFIDPSSRKNDSEPQTVTKDDELDIVDDGDRSSSADVALKGYVIQKSSAMMLVGWGIVSTTDFESEKIRWMGPARFQVQGVLDIIGRRHFNANLYFKLSNASDYAEEEVVEEKESDDDSSDQFLTHEEEFPDDLETAQTCDNVSNDSDAIVNNEQPQPEDALNEEEKEVGPTFVEDDAYDGDESTQQVDADEWWIRKCASTSEMDKLLDVVKDEDDDEAERRKWRRVSGNFGLIMLSNCSHTTELCCIGEDINPSQNRMKLVYTTYATRREMVQIMMGLEDASFLDLPSVSSCFVDELVIEPKISDLPLDIDGERGLCTSARVRVAPNSYLMGI